MWSVLCRPLLFGSDVSQPEFQRERVKQVIRKALYAGGAGLVLKNE